MTIYYGGIYLKPAINAKCSHLIDSHLFLIMHIHPFMAPLAKQ